ncbi:hypothetical protein SAMN05421545_2144 [Pontibacter lucknowensis]|uniref:Uncharacterized protein n=1 Tax=Pontibacter lucknowensis TaxID=1077936 RepID=A0A1N6XHN8_9BACT|nr:hypothetical protein SAMN05421545_2144 [Pontibacter lucknowensis]
MPLAQLTGCPGAQTSVLITPVGKHADNLPQDQDRVQPHQRLVKDHQTTRQGSWLKQALLLHEEQAIRWVLREWRHIPLIGRRHEGVVAIFPISSIIHSWSSRKGCGSWKRPEAITPLLLLDAAVNPHKDSGSMDPIFLLLRCGFIKKRGSYVALMLSYWCPGNASLLPFCTSSQPAASITSDIPRKPKFQAD